MSEQPPMTSSLGQWKTDAWKNPQMVAWYHQQMIIEKGTILLKNAIEDELCRRYAVGERVLDVGIGTGRGSLPLARAGMKVTGVDSSQAMLDQCRKLAGDVPVALHLGDVAKLQFDDGAFDTVMSLNVLVHFPHWREILAEWRRLLRPGGRLLFDIHAMDHEAAACAVRGIAPRPQGASDFGTYVSRLRVAELVESADALGLRIVAVVPYAGLCNENFWLKASVADSERFRRLLSWLAEDEHLFSFALFLEQEVFAYLSSRATDRVMVVLDRVADVAANATWLARNDALDRLMAARIKFSSLAERVPAFDADWRRRLNEHLRWPRNRALAYFLLLATAGFTRQLELESFIDAEHADVLKDWLRREAIDHQLSAHLHSAAALTAVDSLLRHRGVALAGVFEYEQTHDLLANYFGAFEGKRS